MPIPASLDAVCEHGVGHSSLDAHTPSVDRLSYFHVSVAVEWIENTFPHGRCDELVKRGFTSKTTALAYMCAGLLCSSWTAAR